MAGKEGEHVVVEHKTIYEALAAFQAENPEIKKNKHFGKEGDAMHFMYAGLDEFLSVVRPLTSKHGIAIVWEGTTDGKGIVCALYHSTYERDDEVVKSEIVDTMTDGTKRENTEYETKESGVIRSMPISVTRTGKMQDIGKESTYARRYTLSEVLGVASDEDTDAALTGKRAEAAFEYIDQKTRKGLDDCKTVEAVEKAVKVFKDDLKKLGEGKKPALGLDQKQLEGLIAYADQRKAAIEGGQEPGKPGKLID